MTSLLWRRLPAKVIEQQILVSGGAFRMMYRYEEEPEKNRFFFVLNREPSKDQVIVLASATTQREKRRDRRPANVLVDISPSEYQPLEVASLIDCASVLLKPKDYLIERIAAHEVQPLQPLPSNLMMRIGRAVSHARTLDMVTKRLVLGADAASW